MEKAIGLPNVKGGFDLMAVDVGGERLFVAAEDNNTVEVLDLFAGKPIKSISGVHEPKWIVYRPESSRIYVANGGDGTVRTFDSKTFSPLKTLQFKEKANNLRYDEATGLLYVGVGKTFGGIGIIDTKTDTIVGEIPLADFPKQFELEKSSGRVFVNVPKANHVAVLDRKTRNLIATWPVTGGTENVPMGFDEACQRLFLGCDSGTLVVMDAKDGRCIASLPIAKDVDGVWYDKSRHLIYVTCGEGEIDVFRQLDPDHYKRTATIPTAPGAATSLWSWNFERLYLAVPQRENQQAAIRIYKPQ
jgi:DNA-binding beta-propeller fold protein YncE